MPTRYFRMLSDQSERILLELWRKHGVGKNSVREDDLRTEMGRQENDGWEKDLEQLQTQGFLERTTRDADTVLSLTSLGLAVLRQVEEDKLQELK